MTHNIEKPGPAGETHGLIPVTRSEVRDNSAAALTALPHGPPPFRSTEPQRHSIQPTVPTSVTHATTNNLTLPHESKSDDPQFKRTMQRMHNKLAFQVAMPVAPPAHMFHHSGDNRHIVLKGGSSGIYTAHAGVLYHGDNASAEMEGGKFHIPNIVGRVAEDTATVGIAEAFRAGDKADQKQAAKEAKAKQVSRDNQKKADQIRAIPADFQPTGGHTKDREKFKDILTLGTDDAKKKKKKDQANAQLVAQQSDRLKAYQDQQAQQAKKNKAAAQLAKHNAQMAARQAQNKQKSNVPQPTAPVNNTPVAPDVNVKQTEAVGGKSKFWRGLALNISGAAKNLSKFAADNVEGEGLNLPSKKKLKTNMKGGKSFWGELGNNIAHTAVNVARFEVENPEIIAAELAPIGM